MTKVDGVREMARSLREISEGRVPRWGHIPHLPRFRWPPTTIAAGRRSPSITPWSPTFDVQFVVLLEDRLEPCLSCAADNGSDRHEYDCSDSADDAPTMSRDDPDERAQNQAQPVNRARQPIQNPIARRPRSGWSGDLTN